MRSGNRVLDAGCGQGRASLRLAEKHHARISGIDLVPRSIALAKRLGRNKNVDFQIADYNSLPFEDETFDVVFTCMRETFTHSSNPEATIREFLRVLKPGGRIAIFDYSIAPLDQVPPDIARAIHTIAEKTNCPGFDTITHDYYDKLLPKLGVSSFNIANEGTSVLPVIKLFYAISWIPYHLLKLLGKEHAHPNTLIAHIALNGWRKDYIRYITVRITK
ncbi:class I SAM-dependent methyltransferase [Candidatus Saccharibacteria bacterium]|nr:MAG: class I SAM-dependent methyltransferase [Candidatus Saccharibacteria bacterium]